MTIKNDQSKFGFSLIESLVVIAIIGLRSTLSVLAINSARVKARDTKRKADLRNIKVALELYYNDNGVYPPAGGCAYGSNCYVYSTAGNNWIPALASYMPKQPLDPINNLGGPWIDGRYSYSYGNVMTNGQGYDLVGQLENPSDPDRCTLKQYRFNYINASWCGSYSGQMYAP